MRCWIGRPAGDDVKALEGAISRRRSLLETLTAEGTDCYRLWHGIAEERPGLSVDRYGPVLLVQTSREPLEPGELDQIARTTAAALGVSLEPVWNHRPAWRDPGFDQLHSWSGQAAEGREGGLVFDVSPRHRGLDPLLFLDLRVMRRRLRAEAEGQRVLNLFAYTCGVGVVAAGGGAASVLNVDFSQGALAVGRANAERNRLAIQTVHEDVFPVVRQLAGLSVGGRRGRRPRFARFDEARFDLVVLDPPTLARSPWGVVDLVRDYEALFKPAVLCTAEGGVVVATNHVASVDRDEWIERLRRCAAKAGRPLRDVELQVPDADFPSFDGRPPLKIAWCRT